VQQRVSFIKNNSLGEAAGLQAISQSKTIDESSRHEAWTHAQFKTEKITPQAQVKDRELAEGIKENMLLNEMSSNRYSEVVFKDSVFDSRDDSISGINELNLLQELTNFTNMKMMKNKRGKQKQQHCIHFDRVIKN
jgi:hypothetical protein